MPDRGKKLLHLSSVDYGGAGHATLSLHRFFKENGFQSALVVKDKQSGTAGVLQYPDSRLHRALPKLARKMDKIRYKKIDFRDEYHFYNRHETRTVVSAKRILKKVPFKPDVIFLHWVSGFVNARIAQELQHLTGAAMYWLMIDNAPLTGGCHYPWQCEGYTAACSGCPAIGEDSAKIAAEKNLEFKKKFLPDGIRLITFSGTDEERAKKSSLFKNRDIIKMFGYVDETIYRPADNKRLIKEEWGIDPGKKVVFFGASDLRDKRKGFSLLADALNGLQTENTVLLMAGMNMESHFASDVNYAGFLQEQDLIKAYQAADLFVSPSLEDSGPLMVNQAIMCGTPVVAFKTGVAADLVVTGKTGYLAEHGCMEDLRKGISMILNLDEQTHSEWCNNCRQTGLQSFSSKVTLNNYINLFKE